MFVVGNVLHGVAMVLNFAINVLLIIVFVNALLSWVRPDPSSPIVQLLDRVSDLVCDPIRRVIPTVFGGFDLAPLIAMLLLQFLKIAVVNSIDQAAFRLSG